MRNKFEQKYDKPVPLQRKKSEFFSTPIGKEEVYKMEAEYEELGPAYWLKVHGSEKELRPATQEELDEIEKKKKDWRSASEDKSKQK